MKIFDVEKQDTKIYSRITFILINSFILFAVWWIFVLVIIINALISILSIIRG